MHDYNQLRLESAYAYITYSPCAVELQLHTGLLSLVVVPTARAARRMLTEEAEIKAQAIRVRESSVQVEEHAYLERLQCSWRVQCSDS